MFFAIETSFGTERKVVNIRQGRPVISAGVNSSTKYTRITFIADYLRWLAKILNRTSSKSINIEIEAMYQNIKSHRPKMKGRSVTPREDKGLDSDLIKKVIEVSKPGMIVTLIKVMLYKCAMLQS